MDEIIHQPVRLKIMASLSALENGEEVDFNYFKKMLKVTDGNLGAHLKKLENAEYIKIDKTFVDRKPRTFISLTGKGSDAFGKHVAALKSIIGKQ